MSTLWIPTELKNVGALVVLILVLLVRPQGILGASGAGGVSAMDWESHPQNALTRPRSGRRPSCYALAAIGLNVHFGYTGLLNFGQVAFVAVGAYGRRHGRRHLRPVVLARRSSSACSPPSILALLLGVPTLRLRADYLAIVTIAAGEIVRLTLRAAALPDDHRRRGGLQNFAGDFFDAQPVRHGLSLDVPGTSIGVNVRGHQTWVLLVGWTLVALCLPARLPPHAQPVGPGRSRRIREDEDAVRSLGKNVYCVQDAEPHPRRHDRRARRHRLRRRRGSRSCPTALGTTLTFFALRRAHPRRRRPGRRPGRRARSIFSVRLAVHRRDPPRRRSRADYIHASSWPNEVGIVRLILVGLGLMLLMIFRPQGILGDKREVAVSDRR